MAGTQQVSLKGCPALVLSTNCVQQSRPRAVGLGTDPTPSSPIPEELCGLSPMP